MSHNDVSSSMISYLYQIEIVVLKYLTRYVRSDDGAIRYPRMCIDKEIQGWQGGFVRDWYAIRGIWASRLQYNTLDCSNDARQLYCECSRFT